MRTFIIKRKLGQPAPKEKIDTDLLEVLSVTDDNVNDVAFSKITTGNLVATGTITTGSIKTGVAGTNRIEITSSLIGGYASSDVVQFYLSASDGKAYTGAGAVVLDASGITISDEKLFLNNTGQNYGRLGAISTTVVQLQSLLGADLKLNANDDLILVGADGVTLSAGATGTAPTPNDTRIEAVADVFITPGTGTAQITQMAMSTIDQTASRAIDGTVYRNTSGYPMLVTITVEFPVSSDYEYVLFYMEAADATPDVLVAELYQRDTGGTTRTFQSASFLVPDDGYYSATQVNAGVAPILQIWIEQTIGG